MQTKRDKAKLQFFSKSAIDQIQVEINRVSQIYEFESIDSIWAHELLHKASRDINKISWQISAMIKREHDKIDFLRKLKLPMDPQFQDKKYSSFSPYNILRRARLFFNLIFHFKKHKSLEIEMEDFIEGKIKKSESNNGYLV